MDTLALAYRPKTFDDLVGQRVVQVVLRHCVIKNKVPTAMLFDGSHGTGKTTTLRILAASMACDTPPDPCGHCTGCTAVYSGTSLNLVEIDAASHGGVDDIRALRQQLRHATAAGWRIIGIDEAQSMSHAAFNALLKIMEEPPPRTAIVLLTTDPGKIPDTIISRCMRFQFRPLTQRDIDDRIAQICAVEGINTDPELLDLIAERARGSLRDAIMLLDQVTRVGITTVDQYTDLMGDHDPGPALLDVIRTGDPGAAYRAVAAVMAHTGDPATVIGALAGVLRDICIHHSGGPVAEPRRRLATLVDSQTAVAALKVLWDHTTRVRPGDDKRTALDLAVAALTAVFIPTTPTPRSGTRTGSGTVSIADMHALTARAATRAGVHIGAPVGGR